MESSRIAEVVVMMSDGRMGMQIDISSGAGFRAQVGRAGGKRNGWALFRRSWANCCLELCILCAIQERVFEIILSPSAAAPIAAAAAASRIVWDTFTWWIMGQQFVHHRDPMREWVSIYVNGELFRVPILAELSEASDFWCRINIRAIWLRVLQELYLQRTTVKELIYPIAEWFTSRVGLNACQCRKFK